MIPLQSYPRRDHFEYFRKFAYPYTGVTVNVDITPVMRLHRAENKPFFLTLLYQVSEAANAVPALRQRILEDQIVEYPHCDTSHTVAREDGTYAYCRLNSQKSLDDFLREASAAQEASRTGGGIDDGDDADSLLFISCLPWLSYTSLVQAVPCPADSNPRISWGRSFTQEGRELLPLSVLVHHALVDGIHIANFYDQLNARISAL